MIIALLLSVPFFAAHAQLFDPEHRLAIEVLAGTSPVHTLMEKYKEDLPDGASYKNRIGPAASVVAFYDLNEKWSLRGGLNISRANFDITIPEETETVKEHGALTFTGLFSVHYHWLRRDHFRVYSGVGVGMTPKVMMAVFFPTPIPSITPIGFALGTNSIYLTAEITAGGNSVGGLAGLGLRF